MKKITSEELNKDDFKYCKDRLTRRLKPYGFKPIHLKEWETHGPHYPDIPFQIFVSLAKHKADNYFISIHPRAIYVVGSPLHWNETTERVYKEVIEEYQVEDERARSKRLNEEDTLRYFFGACWATLREDDSKILNNGG